MRSFEERIAEIHRRSEKILQARKKRRRILTASCLTLAICVVSLGLWQAPSADSNAMAPDAAMGQNQAGSMFCSYTRVQLTGKIEKEIDDAVKTSQIYGILLETQKVTESAPEVPTTAGSVPPEDHYYFAAAPLRITLITEWNATESYTLSGRLLTAEATGWQTVLTEGQYAQLLDLLEG